MKKVNIIDSNFAHQPWGTMNQKSKYLTWNRDLSQIDKSETIFVTDRFIKDPSFPKNKKIAWLVEPEAILPKIYLRIIPVENMYQTILTHDQSLLKRSSKYRYVPVGGTWIIPEETKIYPKSKLLSIIASKQKTTIGHKLRHEVIEKFKNTKLINGTLMDLYGNGYNFIDNKLKGLQDYAFSIVIENSQAPNYFTEKLLDCFATGTVPIYWGDPNVGKIFDLNGMIIFNHISELPNILNNLTFEKYEQMKPSIEKNFQDFEKYRLTEDWIFENYPDLF